MGKDLNGKKLPQGITQRANGMYRGRFNYNGETYTRNSYNLKEIIQQMEDLRYEVKHGLKGKGDNVNLDSWFDVWLNVHKKKTIKETTQARYYDFYQRYIKKQIGKHKLANINPLILERLFQKMADDDFSTKTIRDVYNILNSMFKYAIHNRLIAFNPCAGVCLPKTKTKEKRVLTIVEQKEVLEHSKGRIYENLIIVALGTGMRAGELLGLTWEDIDFFKKEIHIKTTLVYVKDIKTGEYTFKHQTPKTKNGIRDIPMQDSVYKALKKQYVQLKEMELAANNWEPLDGFNNLVFVGKNGKPISVHSFQVSLGWIEKSINKERMRIAEENKTNYEPIPHFYPHSLRHTFATRCFDAGLDVKTVQMYMGHFSTSITYDTYVHLTNDKSHSEMNKLEALYDAII